MVTSLESKELKWEKNENLNVGIEARLFNRLSATIEYYNRYTKDMLMEYPMAVSLGFSGYDKNIGNMQNSGLEMTLSGDIIRTQNAHWTMTWMGSTVHNKVLHLADKPEIISGNYIIKEGETLRSFYLPESAGVDPATGAKLYWVWDNDENGDPGEKYITRRPPSASASSAAVCRLSTDPGPMTSISATSTFPCSPLIPSAARSTTVSTRACSTTVTSAKPATSTASRPGRSRVT